MAIDANTLYEVIDGTWPAAKYHKLGVWTIREGQGGGQRVSAATLVEDACTPSDISVAETAMQNLDQPRLFMVREQDEDLDAMLAERGYLIVDPVNLYVAPVGPIAEREIPRVCAFTVWEPLAMQIDIWAEAGIGSGRVAVMHRAKGAKTSVLGRLNDHPAGTAFVAIHNRIAMVHALEILPHQRKQGMGGHAMRQAAFWARENGATHISLVVTVANVGGNALYSSLGMQNIGRYHYRKHPEDMK